ncbi:G-protein coupled receptor Mth [Solenopsis invicta]|uniref:G-protein coupled receptor Mth n=1 Tax=Solenopsis invicta TaxID=13686 RepID=UPI00193CBA12|nr:G-protein coupled receptor Mth [Solenopsis invicta]XP_011170601.2 G-protein coupled receptor Mth [Solenopsis invicta]XP_039309643.1 G-protein coupled receptor Mth [Solenopsis invicta]
MSMIRFALLGLLLSLIKESSEWQLMKCCPPGQIFVNSFTNCESIPLFAIEVHYWNITREFQGIPQCNESEDLVIMILKNFESIANLEVPACIEYAYKSGAKKPIIIIRYCQSNKDQQVKAINTSFLQLLHTRKCCFGDTIFDSGTKTCVTRLNESQSLGAFLLNKLTDAESTVILTQGPPKCKGPIVNYEINENDIFLRNNTYMVMIPVLKNNVKEEPVTEDNACLEMTPDFAVKRNLVVRICRDPQFCDTNACIRKCCPEDRYFYEDGCISYLRFTNEVGEFYNAFVNAVDQTNSFTFDTNKSHGILIQKPQCDLVYPYDLNDWEKDVLLTSNGHVFINNYDTNDMHCFEFYHSYADYNSSRFKLFVCPKYLIAETHKNADWWFAILVVKCIFLLMTLLVYGYLPNLQNIHGKTVICYVSSILLTTICAFITNWYRNVGHTPQKTSCKVLAYIGFFSFHAVFFWLNVLCFDIWRTFGSVRENMNIKDRKNTKRLLLYCLHGWGIPLLLSILIIVADNTDFLPEYLAPEIGNIGCALAYRDNWNNYSDLIFAYGPETIVTISNVVFFILTAKYYNTVKADIKNINTDPGSKQFDSIKNRFIMFAKLFIVMGMQWIFETVNYFLGKYLGSNNNVKVFLYLILVLDSLEGLLIFIIFVMKKNVYQAIRKRLQDIQKN